MGHTEGEWKKYGRHIHINTRNTSDEIAYAIWPEWMPESEAEANANLIAAAPEMREALLIALGVMATLDQKKGWVKEITGVIQQALTKAKGVN